MFKNLFKKSKKNVNNEELGHCVFAVEENGSFRVSSLDRKMTLENANEYVALICERDECNLKELHLVESEERKVNMLNYLFNKYKSYQNSI